MIFTISLWLLARSIMQILKFWPFSSCWCSSSHPPASSWGCRGYQWWQRRPSPHPPVCPEPPAPPSMVQTYTSAHQKKNKHSSHPYSWFCKCNWIAGFSIPFHPNHQTSRFHHFLKTQGPLNRPRHYPRMMRSKLKERVQKVRTQYGDVQCHSLEITLV